MRRASLRLSLALLCLAGCGDEPRATASAAPVQGAPIRAAKKADPVPPEAAAIGDMDARSSAESAGDPPSAIAPVTAAPAPAGGTSASLPAASDDDYQEVDFDLLAGFECASYASSERPPRSEERRVGKEWRRRGGAYAYKSNDDTLER